MANSFGCCVCRIELEIDDADEIALEMGDADEIVLEMGDAVIISKDVPTYDGETEVEPKVSEETILPTKDKLLRSDIRVKEISVQKVSTPTGGYVYHIGT